MDFKNNPFKLIILAGFPFPKPDALHNAYEGYLKGKLKSDDRAREYASVLPACVKTMQAIGRGIRKSEDWCYCLLIDDRFSKYISYLAPALKDRVREIDGTQKRKIWEDIYKFVNEMDTEQAVLKQVQG
jgi:DNA excision repair protein ERCC-2